MLIEKSIYYLLIRVLICFALTNPSIHVCVCVYFVVHILQSILIYLYVNTYKYIYEYMYVYIWEHANPCKLTFA